MNLYYIYIWSQREAGFMCDDNTRGVESAGDQVSPDIETKWNRRG